MAAEERTEYDKMQEQKDALRLEHQALSRSWALGKTLPSAASDDVGLIRLSFWARGLLPLMLSRSHKMPYLLQDIIGSG